MVEIQHAAAEAIAKSPRHPLMVTDASGIIQSFNRGAERLLGYAAVDVVGKLTPVDLIDTLELEIRARAVSLEFSIAVTPAFEALTCKTLREGEDCYESTLIRRNRQRVPVSVWVAVLREAADRVIGFVFFMTEVAGQPLAFEAREGQASAELGALAQSNLLARMGHEIRTPLNAILGFAQLMESGTPPPTGSQKRGINLILEAGWHMEKLITMIRDLALIESGRSSLSLAPVSLAAVMHECQAMIESQARRRGVRVIFPALETRCVVSADRIRLQQVLANMVSAAVDYSEVDEAVVVNCTTRGSQWIHIGINAGKDLPVAPLTQSLPAYGGASPEAATAEGLGIGLLLARRLVLLMGGAIGADTMIGAGRLFSFDLTRLPLPMLEDSAFNSAEEVT